MRFGLAVAGPLLGRYIPEYFWPGVGLLAAGALLHLWAKGCLRQDEQLTVCGPYRFSRHPFYLSYLMIDAGLCLMIASIWVAVVYFPAWAVVYWFQVRREERKLAGLFGEDYADYRRRVPVLLPYGPHAPCADGQSFSWSNPNLARRSEIARLLRLAAFPMFFYLAYQVRDVIVHEEQKFLHIGSLWNAFVISLVLSLFFFSKLLTPAVRRKHRMLPASIETAPFVAGVQLAVLAVCLLLGVPEYWNLTFLVIVVVLAAWVGLSAFIGPLRQAYLPLMLGASLLAVAWQMYWLVPIVVFYYACCAIDASLFPETQATE
jgi:isoprenylcysteine carboxyl methyltransferase (ICMT) family protein YpbQ